MGRLVNQIWTELWAFAIDLNVVNKYLRLGTDLGAHVWANSGL